VSFHVGQKIVCIHDGWRHPFIYLVQSLPKKGAIYHVRGFEGEKYDPAAAVGCAYIWLSEIVNPPVSGIEPSFSVRFFRPVTERKTDISVFTKLLTPAPKRLEPVAQMREHELFDLDAK
jgi:hypothetical protein